MFFTNSFHKFFYLGPLYANQPPYSLKPNAKHIMSRTDTIFALATPPAKSGVAVIRLSGPLALTTLMGLCKLPSIESRHAHYASFYHPVTGELIDHGVAIFFKGPNSFTGEDVVELQLHGSIAVIDELNQILGAMPDLRPAGPGEFTHRAFLHGKMDLMEAEGLADLIDAQTSHQKSQALRQMEGELSGFYNELRTDIIRCLAHLEAYIDFPDEDIPEEVLTGLNEAINSVMAQITHTLADANRGQRLRDGITIAILGAPNVGKSSLLNRIAKRDAAIVSHRAGTTRDIIEIHLDIAGYAVTLIDTAGIHESSDDIEQEGIRRALERAGQADIKLVLFDGGNWPALDEQSKALMTGNSIAVINKCDLITKAERISNDAIATPLFISTQTGEGVDALLVQLQTHIIGYFSQGEGSFITRQRHRSLLASSLQSLEKAKTPLPLELKCEELRLAAQSIGEITGKIQVDDVLDVIFSSFCIGK
jgi:tRNA modification GTPase